MAVADDLRQPLHAGLVHIQVLHSAMICSTYRRVCKKFLRTFLLHRIIELNQILPMTSHVSLLIEAVASNITGGVSQLHPGNRFLIIPSTKILFARKSNSHPSYRRVLNSSKGQTAKLIPFAGNIHQCTESESLLPQEGKQPHYLNSKTEKVMTTRELRREMIAESNFFTTVVNSISSGLDNREESCHQSSVGSENEYEVPSKCVSSICENAGMVIESDAAGGKTLLLELLHQIYSGKGSCLLSSKELVSRNR